MLMYIFTKMELAVYCWQNCWLYYLFNIVWWRILTNIDIKHMMLTESNNIDIHIVWYYRETRMMSILMINLSKLISKQSYDQLCWKVLWLYIQLILFNIILLFNLDENIDETSWITNLIENQYKQTTSQFTSSFRCPFFNPAVLLSEYLIPDSGTFTSIVLWCKWLVGMKILSKIFWPFAIVIIGTDACDIQPHIIHKHKYIHKFANILCDSMVYCLNCSMWL